jgi:hypothetical protein
MERNTPQESPAGADAVDEQPTGPAGPDDPYPQPVQEIVDPRDPRSLEDRPRTGISGNRAPRGEETQAGAR